MGAVELNIIDFKEGKFFFNQNIEYTEDVRRNIRLEIRPELIYKQSSDVTFLHLVCIFNAGDAVVMSYDMSLGFIIKDWSANITDKSEEEIRKHSALKAMADVMIGFFRGALAVHAKGSKLENAFFPSLNIDEFVSNIHLRLVGEQKKDE